MLKSALFPHGESAFVAPTNEPMLSAPGAAPLDSGTVPPEAETGRPEVVTRPKSTGMTLRSQSRESRSKVVVSAEIHTERSGFASRPEPEVARPEVEIAPVANPSFVGVAAVGSRSQSVEGESEAGVEPLSGYPLPARQEPETTTISSSFPSLHSFNTTVN